MADGDNLILGLQNDATNETTLHRASANGPGSALFVVNDNGQAIQGTGGANLPGVSGFSDSGDGVRATSTNGNGLSARSTNSVAIFAESANSTGVLGIGHSQPGVNGGSDSSDGVRAVSASGNGLSAFGGGNNGVAVFAQASAKRTPAAGNNSIAGFFDGDVVVSGDVQLAAADCAEEFDVCGAAHAEPGTVMVIAENETLLPSETAYDPRVAGVVAGGGAYKPGIVLDRHPQSVLSRRQISLVGKVFCKVDAQYSPIGVGDMLTTSPTPGHAMAARDPHKAFGAVIGKALRPLPNGQGLIPILITLQ